MLIKPPMSVKFSPTTRQLLSRINFLSRNRSRPSSFRRLCRSILTVRRLRQAAYHLRNQHLGTLSYLGRRIFRLGSALRNENISFSARTKKTSLLRRLLRIYSFTRKSLFRSQHNLRRLTLPKRLRRLPRINRLRRLRRLREFSQTLANLGKGPTHPHRHRRSVVSEQYFKSHLITDADSFWRCLRRSRAHRLRRLSLNPFSRGRKLRDYKKFSFNQVKRKCLLLSEVWSLYKARKRYLSRQLFFYEELLSQYQHYVARSKRLYFKKKLKWYAKKCISLLDSLKQVTRIPRNLFHLKTPPRLLLKKQINRAWKTGYRHQRPAIRTSRWLMSLFLKKRRPLLKKHGSIWERMYGLFNAGIRGRRYDFPGKRERFRWPARVLNVSVVDPSNSWNLIRMRTSAFATVFRTGHSPWGFPKHATEEQLAILSLLLCLPGTKDLYHQEGVLPLAKAPLSLFEASFQFNPLLFAVFWQPPFSPIDCNFLLDNYYSKRPTVSIWYGIVQYLYEAGDFTSRFLLGDFAVRELEFWTQFFNTIKKQKKLRLAHPNIERMLTHPSWFYLQLTRLALAAPFFPKRVRHFLLNNFLVISRLCDDLWPLDRDRLPPQVIYGPFNEVRMNIWFKKQARYLRNQRFTLNHLPSYVKFRRLLRSLRFYRQLYPLISPISTNILYKVLKLDTFYNSFVSKRFERFVLRRKASRRRWRKKRYLTLADKELCRNPYGETRLRRKRKFMANIRPGGIYVSFNKPFLWNLLLLWLVTYFRRVVIGAKGYYLSRWILCAISDFSLTVQDNRPWCLTWATIGVGRFLFTKSYYRLACLHWVRPSAKPRRRAHFRRWFTGFFYRKRRYAWRFRSRIPRYYRRFNFIRLLPFSTFRLFWPQSANFIRPRFINNRRNYRRSGLVSKRRFKPTSFKLIQPRSTYRIKRIGASSLTQLAVSRQLTV